MRLTLEFNFKGEKVGNPNYLIVSFSNFEITHVSKVVMALNITYLRILQLHSISCAIILTC